MFSRILGALLLFVSGGHASISIVFDYTYDDGFFSGTNSGRRALLEAAAEVFTSRLPDTTFDPIVPSGTNHWTLQMANPSTNTTIRLEDPVLAANILTIYVGAQDLDGNTLGAAASPGWSATGDSTWLDLLKNKDTAAGFEPIGGTIAFDSEANWYFDPDPLTLESFSTRYDFYSVAQHEIAHLLGFMGDAAAFAANVSNGTFVGANATALYGGPIPLSADGSHWADNLRFKGAPLDMDPAIPPNTRTDFSALEFAVLDDIGYNVPPQFGTLTVTVNDPVHGTVNSKFLGQTQQEIGRQFAVTATARGGYVFAGWSGDIVSNNNPMYFVMAKRLSFQANFVPSAFINCKGSFYGILEGPETNGTWRMASNAYGAFTGFIVLDNQIFSFHGNLDAQGHWGKALSSTVAIVLDQDLATGAIAGTLSVNTATAQFGGNKLPIYSALVPSPLAGRYTIALPPAEPSLPIELPQGCGCATLKIGKTGMARLVGRLADATPIAAAIPLDDQNRLGLSARFARDYLHGQFRVVQEDPATDVDGALVWNRTASGKAGVMWPAGFSINLAPMGSRWTEPPAGLRVLSALDGNNGMATVELNSSDAVITTTVFVSDRNVIVENPASPHVVKLFTASATGDLRGSFVNGDLRKFRGVFLQKQMVADGYFLNGRIRLTPQ